MKHERGHAPRTWKGGPLGALLLIALAIAVYGPGLASIPPVDRDESRFAQASRQMFESVALPESERDPQLHSGGLGIPMVGAKPRLNKPPLIYWAQTASAALFTWGDPSRDAIWMYRVPSTLAALGAVLITWRLGTTMWDGRAGLLAGSLLAVSPMVIWDAHQARADQLLLLTTTASMWALYHAISDRQKGRLGVLPILALGVTTGLGVLTKGPITPLVVGSSALVIAIVARRPRWIGWWSPLVVTLIAALMLLPWAWLVIERVGADRAWAILHDETIVRSGTAKEGHWGPPGYHLVLLPVLFWPGALLAAIALTRAFSRAIVHNPSPGGALAPGFGARVANWVRTRRSGKLPELFCLAWIVPSWLVFELVSTKLPHYTMPLYPAIALLVARTLLAADAGAVPDTRSLGSRLGFGLWMVLGTAIVVAAAGGMAVLRPDRIPLAVIVFLAGGAMVVVLVRAIHRQQFIAATRAGVVLVILTLAPFLHSAAPRFSSLSASVGAEINALDPDRARPLAAAGFTEDSLVYHTRGRITRLTDESVPAWVEANPTGVLVLSETFTLPDDILPFAQALSARTVSEFTGINLGKGRTETVLVLDAPSLSPPSERTDD